MDTEYVSVGIWVLLSAVQFLTLVVAAFGVYLAVLHQKTLDGISFQVNWRIEQLLAANKVIDTASGKAGEVADQAARANAEALRARHEPR